MKTDDPELEKSRQEFFARIQKINDLILTVIKNHLTVEQFLNDLLKAHGRGYKKKNFAGKMDIAKNQPKPPEIEQPIWVLLKACNDLRNKIAHTFEETVIQEKVRNVRQCYLEALSPEQRKHAEPLDDVRIMAGAFELCGAYIVVAAA
jgi:hypothetical protein